MNGVPRVSRARWLAPLNTPSVAPELKGTGSIAGQENAHNSRMGGAAGLEATVRLESRHLWPDGALAMTSPTPVSLQSSREKSQFSRTKKKGSQWLPSGSTFRDLRRHRRRVLDEAKFALASLQPFAGRASALFLFTMLGIIRIERADEF